MRADNGHDGQHGHVPPTESVTRPVAQPGRRRCRTGRDGLHGEGVLWLVCVSVCGGSLGNLSVSSENTHTPHNTHTNGQQPFTRRTSTARKGAAPPVFSRSCLCVPSPLRFT